MITMKHHYRFIPHFTLFVSLGILLFTNGCGSDSGSNPKTTAKAEIGVPPSISQQKTKNVVTIPEEQAQHLDIQLYNIENRNAHFSINAPGQIFAAPGHISIVSSPINGRVAKIYAHEGERIEKGDPLLDLESLEFADLVGNYLETTAEIFYQEQQVKRLMVLTEEQISAQRTLERAQANLKRAKTRQSAAIARLLAVGITQKDIAKWNPETSEPSAKLTIHAPISGVINEHLIDLGESVNAYDKLLDIIDQSHVLVKGFVSPADAPFIKPGTPVTIAQKTQQSRSTNTQTTGTVTTVNPALDQANRSLVANTIIETVQGWPIVGQRVRLTFSVESENNFYGIPLSAVQFEQKRPAVYVQLDQQRYEKRYIQIERMTEERAIISKGLKPGDHIATTQVFSLKSLERFSQFAD